MTAALSPGLSWLIFGGWLLAVVLIVAFFMGATRTVGVGNSPPDRFGRSAVRRVLDYEPDGRDPTPIRILGGVYDAVARGDFDR